MGKAKQRYYGIKDGNRYYVAVAVLEYDPNTTDPKKKEGVKHVEQMCDKAMANSKIMAADISLDFASIGCMNTNPFAV